MLCTARLSGLVRSPLSRAAQPSGQPAARLQQQRRRRLELVRAQAPDAGAGAFELPGDESGKPFDRVPDAPGSSSSGQGKPSLLTGAIGALKEAVMAYDRAVKKRPVLTKALTSFLGFAIGDRIAQGVGGMPYDPARCGRLSLYGLLIDGPVGHAWYKVLDKHVYPEAPTSNRAVLAKTALDQLVWGPAMTLVFFAFLKTLEGHPEAILATIQAKFWPTMLANYVLWPLAHLVNFKYVPSDWRILFNNVVAIFWTTYLSFTCGPATGGVAGVDGGAAAAAAASALLSALPCSKVPGALSNPAVVEAAQQVVAFEQIAAGWGAKAFSSSETWLHYLQLKRDVVSSVCQPIRLPPS